LVAHDQDWELDTTAIFQSLLPHSGAGWDVTTRGSIRDTQRTGVAIRVTEEEGGTTTTSTMIATMLVAEVEEALATGSGLEEAQFTIGLDHARFDSFTLSPKN